MLETGRSYGYLGPGAVDSQLDHALSMGLAIGGWSGPALDLGSGGGLPGLVLAVAHPESSWVLLDAHSGRIRFLEGAVADLELGDRVEVVRARAEEAGRRTELREAFALVTARGFASPPATAECGSALVAVGGRIAVSEPPEAGPERWPAPQLARLGLRRRRPPTAAAATAALPAPETGAATGAGAVAVGEAHVIQLDKVEPCPDWAPRRTGLPAKRPLF